jgi:hypothetical protein
MKITKLNNSVTGFIATIEGGVFGIFAIVGGYRFEYEDCGGSRSIESRYGESKPVTKNGAYFLPWHVSAALTNNGDFNSCWLNGKSDSEIISELLKMQHLYSQSGDWYNAVRYANKLTWETPAYVY